jgi:hypothetical protein
MSIKVLLLLMIFILFLQYKTFQFVINRPDDDIISLISCALLSIIIVMFTIFSVYIFPSMKK